MIKMMLSFIIVNYNTFELTCKCIESIIKITHDFKYEIIVVDNASSDQSKDIITKAYPETKWIQNTYNAGFGRANNLGVSYAAGEYLLFLNSDVFISKQQNFQSLIKRMEANQNIGVIGCKLLNPDGTLQSSTYYDVGTIRFILKENILWHRLFKPKPKSLDAVMGSFMLMRKKDFDEIGGFDEDFFMYAEELELCMRIKRSGKQIVYALDFEVVHEHGGSSSNKFWTIKQNWASNALLYFKLRGLWGYLSYHFFLQLTIVTNLVFLFRFTSQARNSLLNSYKAYFSNYLTYLKIPYIYGLKSKRNFLKVK